MPTGRLQRDDVAFGTNHFVDCGSLVALGVQPVLSVQSNPLRVTLVTPASLPSRRSVFVVDNERDPRSSIEVRVIKSASSVAIFWNESPLVIATELEADVMSLRADLRAIGINLYDDVDGLHIGNAQFRASTITGAAVAFQLG